MPRALASVRFILVGIVPGRNVLQCLVPGLVVLWLGLAAPWLFGATGLSAQEVSTQPPKDFQKYLQPQLTDGLEAAEAARGVAERVNDGEGGSVLLAETWTRVDDDGRVLRVQHEIYRANTEDMVESVARVEVPFRRGEQRVHVALARTILADGSTAPVRAQSMFVQTPQDRADESLFTDQAELVILFPQVTAGASVEYVVVTEEDAFRIPGEFTGLHVLYYWPVDSLRFALELPADLASRLRVTAVGEGVPEARRETLQGGFTRLTWERSDVPSYQPTTWSQPLSSTGPAIWLSTLASWEDLADWYRGLLAERLELPQELKQQVDEWTQGLDEPMDVVQTLHQKVADDIRYTGLEFGIAGFQPKAPLEVWHDRFGDCKDKANLLRAFLAHKGIRSHMVLLDTEHAGRVETRSPDFRHFNHAILGIETTPGSRRLLFADPTIPYLPPGVLGAGDVDRPVLVVRDEGYQFTRTPKQSAGRVDTLFDLEVDSEGIAGWLRVHVTGARSSAYRSFLHQDELWQRRDTVAGFLAPWFPDAEVVDVESMPDDGLDDEATYVMRAYFLQRGEAFAASREGERVALVLPDMFRRPATAESLQEEDGRGQAYLRPEAGRVRVRYRMPEGWTAASVPETFESRLPTTVMEGSWTCDAGWCTGEVSLQQIETLLDAPARQALGTQLEALEEWVEERVKVLPSAGDGAPQTNLARSGDGDGPELDLEEFPRLTSGAGQLLLVERKYPAESDADLRRAALSQVVEWFSDEPDAVFEAKMWRADLDCTAGDPAGQEAMEETLAAAGPDVPRESQAWGRFLLALCGTVPADESESMLRALAQDESLSDFRRFWSAYNLADRLDDAGRPAEETLAALALAPEELAPDLRAERAVLDAWLRAGRPDLRQALAGYLAGDGSAVVAARLTEALQHWDSVGAIDQAEAIYAALSPLLAEREDLADAAATLQGLGLSAADAEMRAAAAARLGEHLASAQAPDWWQRITVSEADDEAALAAKVDELGQTQHAAEYLRHLGELLIRYPQRDGFGGRLWHFLTTFEYYFPDEPVGDVLVDSLDLLPPSDPNRHEGIFLRARRTERQQGGEAALALLDEVLADSETAERIRVSLLYEQGRILERLGRRTEAIETYSLLVPHRARWIRAIDADLRRALLHLDAGEFEAGLAVATALAEELEENVAKADSPEQVRSLQRLAQSPDEALDYWGRHDGWFADWRALASDLGWTPPESPEAPELFDQTEFGTSVGQMIEAENLEGFLELTDQILRATRIDPALVADAGIVVITGIPLAPAKADRLRSVAIDLLATAPEASSPFDVADLHARALLMHTSILTDAERHDEADELREQYFATAPPEGDVYRRMRLVAALQAQATGRDVEKAAEGLAGALVPEWSDESRVQAVSVLVDLYESLGRHDAAIERLAAEVERAERLEATYASTLADRLESLRGREGEMAALDEALRTWRADRAPSWIEFAEPHDLSDEPWASKTADEWLEDDDLTPPQKVKVALVAGLDDSLTPAARKDAVESLPLALSNSADWHRVWVQEALEPFLDPERWDDAVREEAAKWMAFDAHTEEFRRRVASDPAFQLINEGFRSWLEDRWGYQDVQDGPLPELKAAIDKLLAETVLDEGEAQRLSIYLGSLGYRFGWRQVEPYLASLPDLRVDGEDHGGARLHLEHSRIVRRLEEDLPLDEALRQLALRWSGGETPPEPADWYDLAGFRVTAALLPADEAEAHLVYEMAAQYGGRLSALEVMLVYGFLDDGSDAWLGRFEELVTTIAQHAADDEVRADLLEAAAFRAHDNARILAALESALSPWRRDPDAVDTRALLRLVQLYRSALREGSQDGSVDWAAELAASSMKDYRSVIQSLQIRDLASRDRGEELAALLENRSFDELLDPSKVDDHLIAARAAGDEETEALLVKVARDKLDRSVLSSWARPDGDRIRWTLRLDGILGEPDRIPDEWFAYQRATLQNESLLQEIARHEAERRKD